MQPVTQPLLNWTGEPTQHEDAMTLEELRNQIDILDRQLVDLLSERARAAQMVGHLKAATSLPVYEPAREKVVYANVRAANKGPLPDIELTHIYERIIDVMRALQRNELASERNAQALASGSPATGLDRGGDVASGHGTGADAPEIGNKH
jgi:chorismate mutase-like protein